MTPDHIKGEEELTAELAAIDASLREDAAGLHAFAGRPDLLALARAHQVTVHARRAAVMELLSDAALPRRLAALDVRLETERDALAAERENLAGLPLPVSSEANPVRAEKRFARRLARQAIDDRLRVIGYFAGCRAEVAARMRARPRPLEEASGSRFLGSWRGLSVAPVGR